MREFKEYIKGKRVIFVGACPNLLGLNQKDFIDSFDVVVRANGSHMILDKYAEDYGSRSDVIYFNVQHAREMRPLNVDKYKADGVKFLCFKSLSARDKNLYNSKIPCRDIKETIKKVHGSVYGALMGLFIFEDLLACNPKQLYLTGIDFFQSKKTVFEINNYREYLEGYLPPKIIKQGNEINVGKIEDGHNQLSNTKYIFKLWENGQIEMPDFIRDIMLGVINEI